jgi:uncharacterized protein (TIGR03083 family)
VNATAIEARDIPVIGHKEGMKLAATEYQRFGDLIESLTPEEWATPTVCTGWDVRAMVVHILGEAESNARMREFAHQMRLGRKLAKEKGYDHFVHGVNDVQIAERAHLSPDDVVREWKQVWPKALKGRKRTPPFLRPLPVIDMGPPLGRRTLGYLMDRVLTRDPWMHRIDACRAIGREPVLTSEHDGRLIADMVRDWADTHGHAFELELTGPAGGTYSQGTGGEHLTIDAIEWIWILSGRGDTAATGLLTKELPL